MPDRAERIRAVLATLADGRSRWGAAVVSRDGIVVASQMNRPASEDSFGAMTAAMMGAADAAVQEWADDRPQRAAVEGSEVRVAVVGLDRDFFLATAGPVAAATPTAAMEVDAAASRLRAVLKDQPVVFQEVRR